MNAYLLHKPDGTPAGVSVCGICGTIATAKNIDISEKCCRCQECGQPLAPSEVKVGRSYHAPCRRARDAKIELARFEKAELVEDYDGPVYLEGVGSGSFGDGYFANLDELAEHLDFHEGERPEFAFCCRARRVINIDIGRFLEEQTDDAYEDAQDDLEGTEELAAAFEAFNKANEGVISYESDYKRKVRIPAAVDG